MAGTGRVDRSNARKCADDMVVDLAGIHRDLDASEPGRPETVRELGGADKRVGVNDRSGKGVGVVGCVGAGAGTARTDRDDIASLGSAWRCIVSRPDIAKS
jgi:hypothetical protein